MVWPGKKLTEPGMDQSARKSRQQLLRATQQRTEPYHGYFFKVLKGQGPAAPLGQLDYVIKGVMIGQLALIASQARSRNTGVKSFIVSQDGVVYEKRSRATNARIFQEHGALQSGSELEAGDGTSGLQSETGRVNLFPQGSSSLLIPAPIDAHLTPPSIGHNQVSPHDSTASNLGPFAGAGANEKGAAPCETQKLNPSPNTLVIAVFGVRRQSRAFRTRSSSQEH